MKELSEILVRRSDLELEQMKKDLPEWLGGCGRVGYPIVGNPETAYFVWKNSSRWQEPGQSSGTGLGQQAVSMSEKAGAGWSRSNGFGHTPGLCGVITGKGGLQAGGERSSILAEKEGNSQTYSHSAQIFPPQVSLRDSSQFLTSSHQFLISPWHSLSR